LCQAKQRRHVITCQATVLPPEPEFGDLIQADFGAFKRISKRQLERWGFRASNPVQASILRFGRDTAKWAARICKECRFP
jgi:hypothetical protein